ncbi:MAG TPA: CDP-alcohol phosphatidyltransferase family protein [Alphaproteobacteria bacterium]|jgi:cardiolipin synthase|nr:CDP-alcohol phosphatidyltransferase family protein [Alphaproteobacteria bacterium]
MARKSMLLSIPNLLCYYRLALIPVMGYLFYVDTVWATWLNIFLWSLAGLSDFLDGRIARATGQTSIFGKFLDASTDKLLVGTALMLLIAFDRLEGVWIIPAIIIYLREILISGVREFMALYNVVVPISLLGKWKLTIQMLFMGFLIGGEHGEMYVPYAYDIGKYGFLLATAITVISGWDYVAGAWKTIRKIDEEQYTATSA